ncbi:MAG TPA: TrmH family RNA methyltransferase [Solirubrobacterales bacterium]
MSDALVQRFRAARRDRELAVLEGFHALKHALRFGAEIVEAVAVDPEELDRLAGDLAPDLAGTLAAQVIRVDAGELERMVPHAPRTGAVAIARRPPVDVDAALADERPAPVVLLEDPRTMGNMGACVRVAAAAGAAALLTTGDNDPWSPEALRGAAGLHFALPVASVEGPPGGERPLVAVDPEGEAMSPRALEPRCVLAFGTERHGLSEELLARADERLAIPMRAGVSSLNLATAVAAVLYAMPKTTDAANRGNE